MCLSDPKDSIHHQIQVIQVFNPGVKGHHDHSSMRSKQSFYNLSRTEFLPHLTQKLLKSAMMSWSASEILDIFFLAHLVR